MLVQVGNGTLQAATQQQQHTTQQYQHRVMMSAQFCSRKCMKVGKGQVGERTTVAAQRTVLTSR